MTHDELIPIYERLQSQGYGSNQTDAMRAHHIVDWLKDQTPRPTTLLDASCGRGQVLVQAKVNQIEPEGTEASGWLIENELAKLYTVHHLRYSELRTLGESRYDAVVSNDVLEHLLSEDEATDAIAALASLARLYLCFAVCSKMAQRNVDGQRVILHNLIRPTEWWRTAIGHVCEIEEDQAFRNTHFFFGRKRK